MKRKLYWTFLPLIALFALNGLASGQNRYDNNQERSHRADYDQGYQNGQKKGNEDYKKPRSYDPNRHKDYRNADKGYKSSYGDRRDYQAGYRRGFEDGYRRSYRR